MNLAHEYDAMQIDENESIEAEEANPDQRMPGKELGFVKLFQFLEAISDKLVEDQGEQYEGEKEGGDIRNRNVSEGPAKRTASAMEKAVDSGPSEEAGGKKTRLEENEEGNNANDMEEGEVKSEMPTE